MGTPPDWYRLVAASRYLGVAPWELAGQPSAWIDIAHEMMLAEQHSAEMHQKR